MTRADIEAVIKLIPGLTDDGVWTRRLYPGKTPAELDAIERESREALLHSGAECEKVCRWLAGKEKLKGINDRHTSYGLKHVMEEETDQYVTNGVFIAAAVHCGFPFRTRPDSANVCFGIAERSLRRDCVPRPDRAMIQ